MFGVCILLHVPKNKAQNKYYNFFFTELKNTLLEKQNLLTKTTQELSELGSYKVCF